MQLFVFDVDGTLVNSDFDDALFTKSLKGILDLDCPDDWSDVLHVTDHGIVGQLYLEQKKKDISEKDLNAVRDHFIDLMMDTLIAEPESCRALPGALELFAALQASPDHMVAVATGGWGPTACFKLAHAGFEIDRLIMATSDDSFERTELMLLARERAEERLGTAAGFEKVTYVGDGSWDRDAAMALEWPLIIVGDNTPRTGDEAEPFERIADYTAARTVFGL